MDETFLQALREEETAELEAAGRRRAKVSTVGGAGREAIVAVRGPGDLIGELSAIDGGPRSATVTTLEPVEVLLLPGSAFAALLDRRPRIALVILRMVAGRLRDADAGQAQLGTQDVVGRVSQRVVELADRFGDAEADGRIEIALPLSQEELAAWAGASREAVSKALQVLRSLRIVETGRRHITVLEIDALRRRAAV
jgi:CRP-like cAMP-binding protein